MIILESVLLQKLPNSICSTICSFYILNKEIWYLRKRMIINEIRFLKKKYISLLRDIYFKNFNSFYFFFLNYSTCNNLEYNITMFSLYHTKASDISSKGINLHIQ